MRVLIACFAIAVAASMLPVRAAQDYVALERRLNAEQMHATGLDTLSPEQLALLNRLLGQEHRAVVDAAVAEHAADDAGLRERRAATPVTAHVQGQVRAWSHGDTVLLDNGQRWRVVEGSLYLGKPVINPKVTITPGFMGAWYLQMDGQMARMKVQRAD